MIVGKVFHIMIRIVTTKPKPIRQKCNELHQTSWQLAHPSAAIHEELGVLGWVAAQSTMMLDGAYGMILWIVRDDEG